MSKTNSPVVSVIIPVYNVEPYLRECLESAINQTLRDIEIICVNDGSTDNCPSILEEYKQKDPRFFLIHQENRGLSAARNRGMQHAHGKYIYFLDSDDYIESETLERTYQIAEEYELDAVVFGYEEISELGEIVYSPDFPVLEDGLRVYSGMEYMKEAKDNSAYIIGVWDALWRADYLRKNRLYFREGIIFEDNLFSFLAYIQAERVVRIPDMFYHYRKRPDSITTKPATTDNAIGYYYCAEGILEYALKNSGGSDREHETRRAYAEMSSMTNYFFCGLPQEEKEKISFPLEIENELFEQIIARYQVDDLRKEIKALKEENSQLEGSLGEWQ